jgi:diguanylate cyclase (GGDEF)-like protein/PAS domain S-box-containing protein
VATMETPIRVLIVEDARTDAELAVRVLARAGLQIDHRLVATEEGLRGQLAEFRPHLILSDFSMPHFSGMSALRIARELSPDIPFIFVSGTIGEEHAIRALKDGAIDYVMKTNLARLAPATERALHDAERQAAEREAQAGLFRAQRMAKLGHVISGHDGAFESWSETLPALIGLDAATLPRSTREWLGLVHPEDREPLRAISIAAGRSGTRVDIEYRLQRGSGEWAFIRQSIEPMAAAAAEPQPSRWFNTLQDITEQRQAEEAVRKAELLYRAIFDNAVEGIFLVGADGRVLSSNPRLARMLGHDSPEEMGKDIRSVAREVYVEKDARRRFRELITKHSMVEDFVTQWRRRDGGTFWVSLTGRLIEKETGGLIHHLGMARDITEQVKRDENLRRFRAAMDISGDAILLIDRASMRYVDVNQTFCELVGYTREEMLGMTPMALFSADRETLERDYDAIIADNSSSASKVEGEYRRKDGTSIPIETRRRALLTDSGWIVVGTARDISERKEAEEKIHRLNRVYAVLSGINAAIVRIRDRKELFEEACRIAVEAGGFRMAWLGTVDRAAGRIDPVAWQGTDEAYIRMMPLSFAGMDNGKFSLPVAAVREGRPMVVEDMATDPRILINKEAAKRGFHALAILPLFVSGEVAGVLSLYAPEIGFFNEQEMKLLLELAGDISFALEHIEKSERVNYLAYYDELTGLANRTLFLERLNQCIQAARLAGDKVALVLQDVERLRTVNESLGRQAGDELLKQLAERLRRGADRGEAARISADNFAVMLQGIRGKSEVTRRIERIWQDCFSDAFRLGDSEVRVSAKAGVALFPSDGADAETLLSGAEAALRKARETGERHVFHATAMTSRTGEKLTLENSLRRALEKNEFVLHYQPKVDLANGRIAGAEALIRWQSPELGLVPPGKFIPLMEETGLILQAGAWALSQAVSDHSRWLAMGVPVPRLAVNVSAIQLRRRDFVATVEAALKHGAVPPGIDLEITESLIMEDVQGNIEKLKTLQALGLSTAIDDFGTGYSSLGYLAKLPLQALKIDRSFIITMLDDAKAMTLVQTIISLAHSLRLKVIAEGVETESQAKMLRLLRCDEMQGYLFSRPVPFDDLTALLRKP